ncbi:MAG: galactokinase [Bacteroidales bacterium]|nr:galactokinase [Bacteroidales bacterium]
MDCIQTFSSIYHRDPEATAFCPYRVCPIGAHSDHQHGRITGLALDKGITIAWSVKRNGVVEMTSLQFSKRAQWHISGVSSVKENDWADYLRGATLELAARYPLQVGISGVIEGSLPIGGLSSSAAVTIAFLSALCRANNLHPSNLEVIQMAVAAENKYVGVSSGKLDQSCEIFSRKGHLLYLDTLDDSYELIPENPACKPYRIAVFFSGVERNLVGSKFNMRVDEVRSAAYALKALSGMEYGKFAETFARDVPVEVYEQYKNRLPEPWRRRAEHFYSEYARVVEGAEAWRRGDIERFGKLIFESGHSSVYNWETGSDELKTLYEIMCRTDGIYGGRFSGAGFKGCCMALIDPAYEESILRTVRDAYLAAFPALEGKYSDYVCDSADGVDFE